MFEASDAGTFLDRRAQNMKYYLRAQKTTLKFLPSAQVPNCWI